MERNNSLDHLTFDVSASDYQRSEVLSKFHEYGTVILRNVFPAEALKQFVAESERHLMHPAISGSFGYYKKDFPKSLIDPFLIGGPAVDICLNLKVIELLEAYMESECVLSEAFIKLDKPTPYVYFPMHSDYTVGTIRSPGSNIVTTEEDMKQPLAVGGAIYLRDTNEGAFSYCLGTHLWSPHKGAYLSEYSREEQQEIRKTWTRMDGKCGDIVLFDDRGFHGPAQPSTKERFVMLLDWLRVKSWNGPKQISPFRVYTSDLGRLTQKQLSVLGVGAEALTTREEYHIHKFRHTHPRLNRLVSLIVNASGLIEHCKRIIREKIIPSKI